MAAILTNQGRAITAQRVKGTGAEPNYIGWGTGAGTAAASDTSLFTESSESRVAGTSSVVTTDVTNDTYQSVGMLTAAAAKTITNAGLFNHVSAGELFAKADFSGVPLNEGDAIQFTMKVKYA